MQKGEHLIIREYYTRILHRIPMPRAAAAGATRLNLLSCFSLFSLMAASDCRADGAALRRLCRPSALHI